MIIKDIIKNVPLVLNINLLSGGDALSQSDVFLSGLVMDRVTF